MASRDEWVEIHISLAHEREVASSSVARDEGWWWD